MIEIVVVLTVATAALMIAAVFDHVRSRNKMPKELPGKPSVQQVDKEEGILISHQLNELRLEIQAGSMQGMHEIYRQRVMMEEVAVKLNDFTVALDHMNFNISALAGSNKFLSGSAGFAYSSGINWVAEKDFINHPVIAEADELLRKVAVAAGADYQNRPEVQ